MTLMKEAQFEHKVSKKLMREQMEHVSEGSEQKDLEQDQVQLK